MSAPSRRKDSTAPAECHAATPRRFERAKTLAAKLGVCTRTVRRWGVAGKLTPHKLSARVVLYDEAEVLALIEASRVTHGGQDAA